MAFSEKLNSEAEALLSTCRSTGLTIATAESCTGGLVAALLTELPGSSDVFERGFVTYSNDAKMQQLGVSEQTLQAHGAVSREVALEMAKGALNRSDANLTVSITGIAGPGHGGTDKPVGLVHMATARSGSETLHEVHEFPDIGRSAIRMAAVTAALRLLERAAKT